MAALVLAGLLPWLVSLAANLLFGHATYVQEPLHECLEVTGSCIAIGVAMLLLLRMRHEDVPSHLFWVISALVAMGLVDGVHGIAPFGVAWSWLRHGATLVGGVLFALVWLPLPAFAVRRQRSVIVAVAALTMAASLGIWWQSDLLPKPWSPQGYTLLVKATNALGGLGFLAAAVFFFRRYWRQSRTEDLVFASHTLLFGTAGLLFGFSEIWTADWWVWHAFRLLAYSIVLMAAYEMVATLYETITRHSQDLEDRVEARTAELRSIAQFPEQNPFPVVRVDRAGTVLYANRSSAVLCGPWQCEVGRPVSESFACLVRETLDNARAVQVDVEVGSRAFSLMFTPITDGGYVNLYGCDITARKRAEESLRETHGELEARVQERTAELHDAMKTVEAERERFSHVLDQLPAYLVLLSPDYRVPFANRFFEQRFGKSEGRRCYEYLFNRTEPCENCETYKVMKTGAPHRWEWTGPDDHDYDIYDFPFTDVDGTGLIMEVGLDITDRNRAENALRESEQRYRTLFETMDEGFCVVEMLYDTDGNPRDYRFLEVNPAFEKHTGLQQALGKTIRELIPDNEEHWFEVYDRVARSGEAVRFENRTAALGRWFDVYAFRLGGAESRKVAILFNNINDRKRAEAAMKEANETLEQRVAERTKALQATAEELARSNKDLEQFAYVASHDLQEPLRAVSGFVTLLQQRYQDQLDEKANGYIANTVDGAARMQSLIADLLAYSRVGTRAGTLETTAAQSSLDKALRNLAAGVRDTEAVISVDPLPTVQADAGQLTQLFQNLIGNAIKFRGNRRPEIHVGGRREQDHWLFWVRDNGIGIAPEYAERIFLIFQRLHTRAKYPGTGIGLAICKKIVERHGGKIWVESQPNQGTTFYFTIADRGEHP
jgi:PAS domain S-box-containing protein